MRTPRFRKLNNESTARPFQGWEYKITGSHPDYTLSFNGMVIARSDRKDLLRDRANHHLQDHYPK
jgi:hypothetical protein